MPSGAWNTSYRLALPSGEAFSGFFPYTILTNLPPVPEILNLGAAQTIDPNAVFTLAWKALEWFEHERPRAANHRRRRGAGGGGGGVGLFGAERVAASERAGDTGGSAAGGGAFQRLSDLRRHAAFRERQESTAHASRLPLAHHPVRLADAVVGAAARIPRGWERRVLWRATW